MALSSPVKIQEEKAIAGYVPSRGPAGFKAVCKVCIKGMKCYHISIAHTGLPKLRVGSLLLLSCPACFCSLIQMYTFQMRNLCM